MTDSAVQCPRAGAASAAPSTAPSTMLSIAPAPSRHQETISDPQLSLWLRWHAERDPALRDELIMRYRPHARMLAAKTYARRTHDEVPFADYYQLASVGLIEAVDRFDPLHGIPFEAYCGKRIVGAILNGLEMQTEKTRQVSVRHRLRQERMRDVKALAAAAVYGMDCAQGGAEQERAAAAAAADAGEGEAAKPQQQLLFAYLAEVGVGLALGVLLEDTGMIDLEAFGRPACQEGPEATYFRSDSGRALREAIGAALAQMPQNQQLVIRMHYLQDASFTDIAAKLQLSKGRISQLHTQALLSLRQRLQPSTGFDRRL